MNLEPKQMFPAAKRLQKELFLMNIDPCPHFKAAPKDDSFLEWNVKLLGPPGSVYEEGTFDIEVIFSREYPYVAPVCLFKTKIYHCNVSSQGAVCLDLLNENWTPALSVSKIMTSLVALLEECRPDDAVVPEIAREYKYFREDHDYTCRLWTKYYAS